MSRPICSVECCHCQLDDLDQFWCLFTQGQKIPKDVDHEKYSFSATAERLV